MLHDRVVVAAECPFGSTTYGVVQALRRNGFDVTVIDTRAFFPTWVSPALRAARRLTNSLLRKDYNRHIVKTVEQVQPATFLTVKGMYIFPETIRRLHAMGIKTLNYYPDVSFEVDDKLLPAAIREYGHVFTTKSWHLVLLNDMCRAGRLFLLHHGYCPDAHRPIPLSDDDFRMYGCDVAIIGRHSKYKERWALQLCHHLPNIKIHIWGSRWLENVRDRELRECVRGYPIYGWQYAKAIQAAKINVAIHTGPFGENGYQDQVSTRTFEIPACKGFMLHIDNDEVRSLFEPEAEISVFSDPDQLCQQVERCLADHELRQKIRDAGYARCVPAYSYDQRVAQMIPYFGG